ncbi:MAG: hypothetical protein ACFFFB_18685 [Candidatus Heimdallarchaeota archaeon]
MSNSNQDVITIRIDQYLNNNLNRMKERLGLSKADLIRNYLDMSKFIIKQRGSIKSLNNRDFIIIKRSYVKKLIDNTDEQEQIRLGDKLARFINDIARINGKEEDIVYKLEFCDNLGFFRKFIDEENYLLVTKEFGPQKFVESFLWRIYHNKEMNTSYIEEEMKGNKSLRAKYKNEIQPVNRSSSHYSFEFAKISELE